MGQGTDFSECGLQAAGIPALYVAKSDKDQTGFNLIRKVYKKVLEVFF